MGKGQQTRERILEVAEAAVLAKGFSNTSIDEIIAEVELTKNGFFYHFKDKTELAKAMLQRYIENDNAFFDDIFGTGRELSEDPLHAFLIGLKIFAERMGEMETAHPGCLIAAFAYHDKQYNADMRQLNSEAIQAWRVRFRAEFERIAEVYPPKVDVDLDHLADMITVVVEGGIVLSKAIGNPRALADQLLLFRTYVRTVFLGS